MEMATPKVEISMRLAESIKELQQLPAPDASDAWQQWLWRLENFLLELSYDIYPEEEEDSDELVLNEITRKVELQDGPWGPITARLEYRVERLVRVIASHAPAVILDNQLKALEEVVEITRAKVDYQSRLASGS